MGFQTSGFPGSQISQIWPGSGRAWALGGPVAVLCWGAAAGGGRVSSITFVLQETECVYEGIYRHALIMKVFPEYLFIYFCFMFFF